MTTRGCCGRERPGAASFRFAPGTVLTAGGAEEIGAEAAMFRERPLSAWPGAELPGFPNERVVVCFVELSSRVIMIDPDGVLLRRLLTEGEDSLRFGMSRPLELFSAFGGKGVTDFPPPETTGGVCEGAFAWPRDVGFDSKPVLRFGSGLTGVIRVGSTELTSFLATGASTLGDFAAG